MQVSKDLSDKITKVIYDCIYFFIFKCKMFYSGVKPQGALKLLSCWSALQELIFHSQMQVKDVKQHLLWTEMLWDAEKCSAYISLNHRRCNLINHTKLYCVSGYILINRAAAVLTLTWEWCEVRVLVAPVCVTTHGVNPRVVLVGGRADEGPVAWDQLDVADAPALLRGDAARSSDGHVAQAVCGTRVVRAPVTVAL